MSVSDNVTQQPVPKATITAYRIQADGEKKWVTRSDTDDQGQVVLDLEGIEEGVVYQLSTNALNNSRMYSQTFSETESVEFVLGRKFLRVVDGSKEDSPPLVDHQVIAKRVKSDGKLAWVTKARTDEIGVVRFNLSDTESSYVFESKSSTGDNKRTEPGNAEGEALFVVGNIPLNVSLVHGITGQPLAGQRVWAKEYLADGSLKHRYRKDTDEQGNVVFDLDRLGEGATYQLYSRNGEGFSASVDVETTGDVAFEFGDLQLTLRSGRDAEKPIIPDTSVTLYRVSGDSRERIARVTSNASGQALFDVGELPQGTSLVAKLKLENKHYEASVTELGQQSVEFGKLPQPVTVTLFNTATNAPVVGERVTLRRWEGDKRKFVARADTDEEGLVSFDAQGFYEGQVMFVEFDPFDGSAIRSENITEPTDLAFNLHLLEDGFVVNLVDGTSTDKAPMPEQRIDVYKVTGEERSWYTRKNTDESGVAKFTLPELDQGQQYVLKSRHPVNNKHIYSESFSSNGSHEFALGFLPLEVTLVNPIDGSPISNARVDAMRPKEGGGYRREGRETTDEAGKVLFHLSEISEETPILLRAETQERFSAELEVQQTGEHEFRLGNTQLTLLNGRLEDNPVLAETRVKVFKQIGEERERVFNKNSDSQGRVLMELPELNEGEEFVAEVRIENKTYRSSFTELGASEHVFGKLPQWVTVTLNNTRTNQPISDMRVSVYDVTEEQRKWAGRDNTDEQGQVQFDLQGLYEERSYQIEIKPFDGEKIRSDVISEAQEVQFDLFYNAEGLPIAIKNGADNETPPLIGKRIDVYRVIDDERKWYTRKDSDENGMIFLKLPDLDQGQEYVLAARSETNNVKRYSEPFGNVDNFEFVVGNPPVNVTLLHGITGDPITGLRVNAERLNEEGKFKYYQRSETNEAGVVSFDLADLGMGAQYRFRADYLNTGRSYTEVISEPQDVDFVIGNVPVTLLERDTNLALSGVRIEARWLDEENKQRYERRGDTDGNGEVLFDLSRLSEGTRYVLKAKNPFGENKTYYGPIIYDKGPVQFALVKGEYGELDLVDPEVAITAPTRESVNSVGFTLAGTAQDDNALSRIEVSITDPVKGIFNGVAEIQANNQWQFEVPASALTVDQQINVTVDAFDLSLNSARAQNDYLVVADSEDPVILVVSHQDNDSVNETGFSVVGTATDDTGNVRVEANLVDPVLGASVVGQQISVAPDGQWAFIVTNGKVTGGETVSIELTAIDSSDKRTTVNLQLQIQTIVPQQQQLVSRITFGMTPELYINQPEASLFLQQQLNPQGIDDSAVEQQVQSMELMEIDDLKAQQMHRMLYSERQLNELMTWFWDNHFNTNFNVHRNLAFEVMENSAFRANALGNFRDLLGASAKSPAMIYYLNNAQNEAGRPNENYAREIMELHTLGVDGGYTAQDISELARIFTGWHEQDGAFFFNEESHDFEDKVWLGINIPGTGLDEGEQALDILASHPNTARNICRKLVALFVSDQPVASLQGQCEGEFMVSGGDISSVLQVILGSSEFVALENQDSKIKTPLELVLSAIRSVNASPDYDELSETLSRLGFSMFEYPVPTGLSEASADWLTSDALLQRIRFANRFALEGEEGASVEIRDLLIAMGYSSPDAIVALLADLCLNGRLTDLEREVALEILNANLPEGEAFAIDASDADEKLQRLLGTMMSFPAFQYQ